MMTRPTSTAMFALDSQESYSSDLPAPYDDGSPPTYDSPRLSRVLDDETPLIVHHKRRPKEDGPRSVDDAAYDIGRVLYDLNTLRDVVEGIEALKGDISTRETVVSTLEALARRTESARLLLSSTLPALRNLDTTLLYLKPAAGAFVVSSSQTFELKQQLAQSARALDSVLDKVKEMEKTEEGDDKKDARMRMLKFIKGNKGEATEPSELMALLLGAEKDGAEDYETLEVNSFGWRWAVERPGVRLARIVDHLGDVSFLSKIEHPAHPAHPAPSLWANTWAYVPTLYAATSTNRKTSGYSAAGTKESMPVDASDEETGNYGEPLDRTTAQGPFRYKLWLYVAILLAALAASGVGVGFWVRSLHRATASGGGEGQHSMSTYVNVMPAHSTAQA